MERCEGDLLKGTGCKTCDRCVAKAKEFISKYGRISANKLDQKTVRLMDSAIATLIKKLGIREFQKLFRGVK